MVLGTSYGDENEIQYFTQKKFFSGEKYQVLKENDLDSRENCKLKKVVAALDDRDHCTFVLLVTIKLYRHLR